jgi:gluconolactonase
MTTLAALLVLASATASLDPIMPKGTRAQEVATGFAQLDGLAWDGAGTLYFADTVTHTIHKLGADGKATVHRAKSGQANGLTFDQAGRMVIAESTGRRIARAEKDGAVTTVADKYKDKRLNSPNDVVIDAAGGIYFTDSRFEGKSAPKDPVEQDKEAVYYITPTGEVTRLATDAIKPDGLALSPDGRVLYVGDAAQEFVLAYEVKGPGDVANGRVYAEVKGNPGGMCVDATGRLYVAAMAGIWVFNVTSTGTASCLGVINVPQHPANCGFGGAEMDTLFVTTATTLYKVKLSVRGWALSAKTADGGGEAGAPRMPQPGRQVGT